jgi:hypothetical protein
MTFLAKIVDSKLEMIDFREVLISVGEFSISSFLGIVSHFHFNLIHSHVGHSKSLTN